MKMLTKIWPWSKISFLEKSLDDERKLGATVVAYLDKVEPGVRHILLNGHMYCMGVDYCNEILYVPNPRMNYKVEGFDA